MPKPLQQCRHVNQVGLVVAGQCIHDDVDASAERHLALPLPAWHHGIEWPVAVVERPGGGEVVGGDQNRAPSQRPGKLRKR